jgi:hypothetical protein
LNTLKARVLTAPLTFEIVPALGLPPALQARTDALWREAVAARPQLFDGPVLTVIGSSADHLVLARSTYRHVVAARLDAEIREAWEPRPLAVSGILTCPAGLVWGRRSEGVCQGRGLWELVPSGGREAPAPGGSPEPERQILAELAEEIGLAAAEVSIGAPIGLVEDSASGTVDIVLPLATPLSGAEILARHEAAGSGEYDALEITPAPRAFAGARHDILPASRLILDLFVP